MTWLLRDFLLTLKWGKKHFLVDFSSYDLFRIQYVFYICRNFSFSNCDTLGRKLELSRKSHKNIQKDYKVASEFLKFMFTKKATKNYKIFTVDLTLTK